MLNFHLWTTLNVFKLTLQTSKAQYTAISSESNGLGDSGEFGLPPVRTSHLRCPIRQSITFLCAFFYCIFAKPGIMLHSAVIFLCRSQTSQDTVFITNCFYSTFHNHNCDPMILFNTMCFSLYLPSSNWEKETPHMGKTFITTNLGSENILI